MSAYQQASTVHCSSERERASTVHRSSECERASMVHRSSECERASTVHQHHDVRLYLLLIRIDSQASLPRPRPRAPRRDVTALSIMKRARGSGAGRWWAGGGAMAGDGWVVVISMRERSERVDKRSPEHQHNALSIC